MSLTYTSVFSYTFCPSQIGSGIGRMILKEEMKARSGSYDNDPWGSARNSRSGSKETLNTTSYGTPVYNNTINGCKDRALYTSASGSFLRLGNLFSWMFPDLSCFVLAQALLSVWGRWGE